VYDRNGCGLRRGGANGEDSKGESGDTSHDTLHENKTKTGALPEQPLIDRFEAHCLEISW
jgi:hypothetical protein